jgi:hypothetical protein
MSEEEILKVRIEGIIKDPKISKKVLFEIDQYIGKQLLELSNIKTKIKP